MIVLIVIGLVMMISTSSVIGFSTYNDSYYFIKKHLLYIFLGIGTFLVGFKIPYFTYKKIAVNGFFLSLILLVLTLVSPIGVTLGGASRWINLGLIQLQPVEVMKFFIIIFLATALSNKKENLADFMNGLLPVLVMLSLPLVVLAIQPDLGNIMLILIVSGTLLLIAPTKLRHLVALASTALGAVSLSILKNSYQLDRIKTFLSPWDDPMGKNYHIIQSFIAIGSGGLFGLGLGQSKLKYYYLPLQYSDFIFSIICEEGGFIAAVTVILCFGMLFFRGVRIAMKSPDEFSFYVALGIIMMLTIQAFINIAVVIGVFPVTGIPLTFISFGGTSLITSMFLMGVLLNISSYKKAETYDS